METLNRENKIKISPILVKATAKSNTKLAPRGFFHNSGPLRFTQKQLPLKISSQPKVTNMSENKLSIKKY